MSVSRPAISDPSVNEGFTAPKSPGCSDPKPEKQEHIAGMMNPSLYQRGSELKVDEASNEAYVPSNIEYPFIGFTTTFTPSRHHAIFTGEPGFTRGFTAVHPATVHKPDIITMNHGEISRPSRQHSRIISRIPQKILAEAGNER